MHLLYLSFVAKIRYVYICLQVNRLHMRDASYSLSHRNSSDRLVMYGPHVHGGTAEYVIY